MISAIGVIVPATLDACVTTTRRVRESIASAMACGSTEPRRARVQIRRDRPCTRHKAVAYQPRLRLAVRIAADKKRTPVRFWRSPRSRVSGPGNFQRRLRSGASTSSERSNFPRIRSCPAPSTTAISFRAVIDCRAFRISSIEPNGSFVPCTKSAGVRSAGK